MAIQNYMLDEVSHNTERKVTTMGDAFGNLGGLNEILKIAISFCVSGMAYRFYQISLINAFFYV